MSPSFLVVMCGGAVGAAGRYAISVWAQRAFGASFPVGTATVNLLGALLFGFFWAIFEARSDLSPEWRVFVLSGALGAFTTFSTFAYEGAQLFQSGRWHVALLNLGMQNALGIGAVFLGLLIGGQWD